MLYLTVDYSTSGTIRIQDETVIGIANDFLSDARGWILGAIVVVAAYAVDRSSRRRASRRAGGLDAKPTSVIAAPGRRPGAVVTVRPSGTPTGTAACPSSR